MTRYFIVGIAGAGMSAIANILLDQGHVVDGLDMQRSGFSDALVRRGVTVSIGHYLPDLSSTDALVVTSAARSDHPAIVQAQVRGIPVLKRADLWRDWSREREVVAVAGTHGKTTTTALIALALRQAGVDAGFLVGGEVPGLGTNAQWGAVHAPLVIEADEYDRTFLALTPRVAVITNIEWDHVDSYPSAQVYDAAFCSFVDAVGCSADILLCGDDPGIRRVMGMRNATWYGLGGATAQDSTMNQGFRYDWQADRVRVNGLGMCFDVWHYDRSTGRADSLGEYALAVPGLHNVSNGLAALATVAVLGIAPESVAPTLACYRGVGRRFEVRGEVCGVMVIDDYAHHPTEVRATLAAARGCYPQRRIVAYLQPHTYSRTKALLTAWAGAFGDADVVRVGDVYAARETDTLGVGGDVLARAIDHCDVQPIGATAQAVSALLQLLRPGDVLLTLGAGDGYSVGTAVLQALEGNRPEYG